MQAFTEVHQCVILGFCPVQRPVQDYVVGKVVLGVYVHHIIAQVNRYVIKPLPLVGNVRFGFSAGCYSQRKPHTARIGSGYPGVICIYNISVIDHVKQACHVYVAQVSDFSIVTFVHSSTMCTH